MLDILWFLNDKQAALLVGFGGLIIAYCCIYFLFATGAKKSTSQGCPRK
ncbi:MAG TPA: hypothetical protein VMX18_00610 [Candidatus Bipolaricaulota bacterium]|nr:hypothetical protein [Candidatus Bipolaricaulota bacterium]